MKLKKNDQQLLISVFENWNDFRALHNIFMKLSEAHEEYPPATPERKALFDAWMAVSSRTSVLNQKLIDEGKKLLAK